MNNKYWDLTMILIWTILGVIVLIAGPTRISYGCVLVCYLAQLIVDYIIKYKNNDDNNTPLKTA